MKTKESAFEMLRNYEISSPELVKGGGWICCGSWAGPNGATTYDWMQIDSQGNPTGVYECDLEDHQAPGMH